MSVKISRVNLSSLWNSEFPLFVEQLSNITRKHTPADLHLAKPYARVTTLLPQLAKIKAQELSNVLSNKMVDLDTERDVLLIGIQAQVKTYSKLSLPDMASHVEVMKRFFSIHGTDITTTNYNAETKRVNDLLAEYDAKADVKAAAEALHLTPLFEQLRVVNAQFANVFLQRTEDNSTTENVDVRGIRVETSKQVVALLDAIEYCSAEYETTDYQPLANELNDLIEYYKTQVKARTTRRNAGKVTSTEVPIAQ